MPKFSVNAKFVSGGVIYVYDNGRGEGVETKEAAQALLDMMKGAADRAKLKLKRVAYRDQAGDWHEIVHENGTFIEFKDHTGPPN